MTLIITIVIMLILTGVTIGITTNKDGLIEEAKEQVNKTNNRIAKEEEIVSGIIDDIKDELKVDVSGVVLDTTNVTLKIGDTKTITATVVPQNSPNKAVTWSSSDDTIATVNNGVVTAIKEGTAVITVTTQEGNQTASCRVTVDTDAPTAPTAIETVKTADTAITVKATGGTDTTSEVVGYKYSTDNTNWSETVTAGEGYSINYASVNTVNNTWDTEKVSTVVGEGTRKAPIPAGYTVSGKSTESTISQGLVIYQNETRVLPVIYAKSIDTVGNESEVYTLDNRTIYNQYVWIPVDDINDMVMCKSNGTAGTGGSTCNLVYEVSSNHITCNTHGYTTATALTDENIDSTGLAGRLYGTSSSTTDTEKPIIYTTSMDFTTTSQTFSANSGYREPAIVTGKDQDDATSGNTYMVDAGIVDGTVASFKAQLNSDFIAMAKSVAKYGGFYISRYEPSYEASEVISQKNKAVLTATASTSGNYIAGNKWYGLYNKTRNETEKANSVSSHMVWGCQYDQVIEFLGDKAEVGHLYQTTSQQKTGYADDKDVLNNIYDLEGNNYEWTAQASGTNYRVSRGSYYSHASDSSFYPASYRNGYSIPTSTYYGHTTRPTLCVAL